MKNTRFTVIAGAILGLAGSGAVVAFALPDKDYQWALAAAVYFLAVLISAWGMWQWRLWALRLSQILATGAFAFGCYIAHFRWTFWLFREPALLDRIKALFYWPLIAYLILPLLWLVYFFRPSTRNLFAK